jgi:hypothetical protein
MPCAFLSHSRLLKIEQPSKRLLLAVESRLLMLEKYVPWPALVESTRADLTLLRSRAASKS